METGRTPTDASILTFAALTAAFAFLLTCVTGILAWYTYKLWTSTALMVATTAESAERQLRAYVSVLASQKFESASDPRVAIFQVRIRNAGRTPAYDLTSWIGMKLREVPLAGELEPPPRTAQPRNPCSARVATR